MVEEAGLKKSEMDDCLFWNGKIYVCIHVDDILYCGNSADMDAFFAQLESKFGMHDLREASTYTGQATGLPAFDNAFYPRLTRAITRVYPRLTRALGARRGEGRWARRG